MSADRLPCSPLRTTLLRRLPCSKSPRPVSETSRKLSLSQIENKLAAATLDANRGQHEPARQSASQFFTLLRDELDRDKGSSLTPAQREQARQLLNQRDDIITLLARSDPASSKKFADLYVAFRKSVAGAPAETK